MWRKRRKKERIRSKGDGSVIIPGENGNINIADDFSSVMTAISDEKTQRETTDNEIKSTLDTKADKTELDGKFDKVDVVQNLGNAGNKVISQNTVSYYFNTINSKMFANNVISHSYSYPLEITEIEDDIRIDFNIGWNNYSSMFASNEKFSTTSESEIFILSCDKHVTGICELLASGFLITKYDGVLYLSIGAKENWIVYNNLKNGSSGSSNKNTSIFQIGDSITWQKDNKKDDDPVTNQYVYKGNGFVRYICEKLGIPANRHFPRGQNGQTIIGYAEYLTNNPDAFPKSSADLSNIIWIIELGTNDWGAATEIGSKSDYTNNNGNNSVYGALRTIVDYILPSIDSKQAPHVIMLTPMDRGAYSNNTESSWKPCSFSYNADGEITFTKNEKNYTINDYAEAIRWVCEREGFVCIDFLKNPICSRKYFNRAMTFSECVMQNDTNTPEVYQDIYGDNLHPTDKGDKMMGEFILKKAKHIFNSI